MKVFPPIPSGVDDPAGVLTWTTRAPTVAPLATEIVMVTCVPSAVTVRLLTVIALSAALFLRNVTLVAPPKPAPVIVTARFDVPAVAVAGTTALMNGWTVTATAPNAVVGAAGDGVDATWRLSGPANAVAEAGTGAGSDATCTLSGTAAVVAGVEPPGGAVTATLTADTLVTAGCDAGGGTI